MSGMHHSKRKRGGCRRQQSVMVVSTASTSIIVEVAVSSVIKCMRLASSGRDAFDKLYQMIEIATNNHQHLHHPPVFVVFSQNNPLDPRWNDGCGCMHAFDFVAHFLSEYSKRREVSINIFTMQTLWRLISTACKRMCDGELLTNTNINRVVFACCIFV